MNDVEWLVAVEKIKALKARYFRMVDMKDWSLGPDIFTTDIECDVRGSATDPETGFNAVPDATAEVIRGLDAIMTAFESAGAHFRSVHHGHDPDITITSEVTANGIWSLFDSLRFESGPIRELNGYGHYHESYEKGSDGKWRIKSLRITRLRVDCIAA